MYAVEDELFQQARFILAILARELISQRESGVRRRVDLQELVRRSADADLPKDGEADYLHSLTAKLERTFPVEELFPRGRRAANR